LTTTRIFSPTELKKGKLHQLGADNHKYLKSVLRLRPGSRIHVFDGYGQEFAAVIRSFSRNNVEVELGEQQETALKEIKITLAQALPKAHKMDTIVRSAAELGTDEILPFVAKRSVSHASEEKKAGKAARWQKIAQEAARSSRSSQLTIVGEITTFESVVSRRSGDTLALIFWEEEENTTIRDVLKEPETAEAKNFFLVIGPEGGFTRDEVSLASDAGFISVSLGKQILKVETAALAIIAIIQYEKGILGKTSQR